MLSEVKEQKQERKERSQSIPKPNSNVMMVRIRKDEQGEPEGEIIHLNLKKPVPYQGMAELGFRIDEIARLLNLPESSRRCHTGSAISDSRKEEIPGGTGRYHSLGKEQKEEYRTLQKEFCQVVPTEQWKREDFICRFPARRTKEIVSVELLGRHYRSLQGRLRCRGTREQYVYFRSALELMHLFTELLQDMENGDHPLESEVPDRMEEPGIL